MEICKKCGWRHPEDLPCSPLRNPVPEHAVISESPVEMIPIKQKKERYLLALCSEAITYIQCADGLKEHDEAKLSHAQGCIRKIKKELEARG